MDILGSDCSRREKIMLGNRDLRNGAKVFVLRLHTMNNSNNIKTQSKIPDRHIDNMKINQQSLLAVMQHGVTL